MLIRLKWYLVVFLLTTLSIITQIEPIITAAAITAAASLASQMAASKRAKKQLQAQAGLAGAQQIAAGGVQQSGAIGSIISNIRQSIKRK